MVREAVNSKLKALPGQVCKADSVAEGNSKRRGEGRRGEGNSRRIKEGRGATLITYYPDGQV